MNKAKVVQWFAPANGLSYQVFTLGFNGWEPLPFIGFVSRRAAEDWIIKNNYTLVGG